MANLLHSLVCREEEKEEEAAEKKSDCCDQTNKVRTPVRSFIKRISLYFSSKKPIINIGLRDNISWVFETERPEKPWWTDEWRIAKTLDSRLHFPRWNEATPPLKVAQAHYNPFADDVNKSDFFLSFSFGLFFSCWFWYLFGRTFSTPYGLFVVIHANWQWWRRVQSKRISRWD